MANVAYVWGPGFDFGYGGPGPGPSQVTASCTCVVIDDSGNVVANSDPVQDNYSPHFVASITSADTLDTIRANWLGQIQTMYGDPNLAVVYMG